MYSSLKLKIDKAMSHRNQEKYYMNDIGSYSKPINNSIKLFGLEKILNRNTNERCQSVVYLYAEGNIRIEYGIETYIYPHNITQDNSIKYEIKENEVISIDRLDNEKISSIFSYLSPDQNKINKTE